MSRLPIPFWNPATYPGHSGVDYPQRSGTVFRASGPGVVGLLGRNALGGFYIFVQYDAGPLVGYHHMDSHAGCPPVRTRVAEGTPLGYVGNSGRSTGPHLHSEVAGDRTTAGYWRAHDPGRVVGSSGGSAAHSRPSTSTTEEDMKFWLLDDDGNGKACWVLLSPRTGRLLTTYDQALANSWASAWGNASPIDRQSFLNAHAAVEELG